MPCFFQEICGFILIEKMFNVSGTKRYPEYQLKASRKKLKLLVDQQNRIWKQICSKLEMSHNRISPENNNICDVWCPSCESLPPYWSAPVMLHDVAAFNIKETSECEVKHQPEKITNLNDLVGANCCPDIASKISASTSLKIPHQDEQPLYRNEASNSLSSRNQCDIDTSECSFTKDSAHEGKHTLASEKLKNIEMSHISCNVNELPGADDIHRMSDSMEEGFRKELDSSGQTQFEFMFVCDVCKFSCLAKNASGSIMNHLSTSQHYSVSKFLGLRDSSTGCIVPRYLCDTSNWRLSLNVFRQKVLTCPACYSIHSSLHDCLHHTMTEHNGLRKYCVRSIYMSSMTKVAADKVTCMQSEQVMCVDKLSSHVQKSGHMAEAMNGYSALKMTAFPCLYCPVINASYLEHNTHVFSLHSDHLTGSNEVPAACFSLSGEQESVIVPESDPGIPVHLIKQITDKESKTMKWTNIVPRQFPKQSFFKSVRVFLRCREFMIHNNEKQDSPQRKDY